MSPDLMIPAPRPVIKSCRPAMMVSKGTNATGNRRGRKPRHARETQGYATHPVGRTRTIPAPALLRVSWSNPRRCAVGRLVTILLPTSEVWSSGGPSSLNVRYTPGL
jgi:hypothetical protein